MHGYRPCTNLVLIDGVTARSAFPACMNRLELLSQLLLMKPMSHQPFTELLSMPFHSVRLSPPLLLNLLSNLLIQDQLVLGQWGVQPLGPLDLQQFAMGLHLDLEMYLHLGLDNPRRVNLFPELWGMFRKPSQDEMLPLPMDP